MAEKCIKCALDIAQIKDAIKCSECSAVFQPQCAGLMGDKKISTRKAWKCEICAVETLSISNRANDAAQSAVLETISALRKDISDLLDITTA